VNQRIKELAKQTGYIWHASGDPQIYEFTPEKLKKFAELIVRECADIGERYADGNYEVHNQILEHFGVEE
jgi:hypothetical protein